MKKLVVVGTNTIHTYNFIELIQDYFDDILLITNKKKPDSLIKAVEVDFGLKISGLFNAQRKIRAEIEKFNPAIVHIHQANSVAFYTLFSGISKKYPTVLTAWGSDVLLLPKKNWILKKMVQYNLNRAKYFTSDSLFMAKEMMLLSSNVKNVLVANFGINVTRQNVQKEKIIYSNRLHKPLYNVDKIIDSFIRFKSESLNSRDWKLVIAATGEDTDKLKDKAAKSAFSDQIDFVGWVDKETNAYWYSKSRIWISIPDSDATSISLLEAMECGCIPVVSDLPANREWITDRVNGIIVENNNLFFLSDAMELDIDKVEILNRERIKKDGLKSSNREKFIDLYKEIENSEK